MHIEILDDIWVITIEPLTHHHAYNMFQIFFAGYSDILQKHICRVLIGWPIRMACGGNITSGWWVTLIKYVLIDR